MYYNSIIQAEKSKYAGFLIKDKNNLDILLMNGVDIINHHILSDEQWEPHVQNVLSQILKPKDKVLVLREHIGIHTTLISKLISKDGKVFIFEPNPKILKFLRTNLFLNNAENVTLYSKAAFSSNTNVAFIAKALENVGGTHIIASEEDKNENLE
ncbi:FkbM family methyltransferase [Rickettsia endosymbiont of Cantharis rufa]|uniref:FkbM family methyltransferase n=1 Tax=Rickettsia endosymbiont of Cantharis rufa TaxID=3066248 RepID=UPI003132FFBB